MKTKRLFLAGSLLIGITAAFGQKYIPEDDIYYQPDDKNPIVEEKKKDKLTEEKIQRTLVMRSNYDRDVDEYNRRYTLPVDSLLANQEEDAVTYDVVDENGDDGYYLNGFKGSQSDYEYARRVRLFHDPKYTVHISDPSYTDIYFLDSNDWNVYIDDSYAWVTPTWTNPWSWNFNWSPYSYTSFSWRLNPYFSVSWGGWGPGWGNPYYNWGYPYWGGWGPGWGGCYPSYGWCNPYWGPPAYYPPHHSRPAYQYSSTGRSSIGSRSSGRSSSGVSTGRSSAGRSSSSGNAGTVVRPSRSENGTTVTTPVRGTTRPATTRTRTRVNTTTRPPGSGSTVTPVRPSRGSSNYNPGSSSSYQRGTTGRTSRSSSTPSYNNSRSTTPSYNSGRSSSSRSSYSAPSGGGRSSSSGSSSGARRGR